MSKKINKALLLLNMGGVSNIDEVDIFLKNMFADKNILNMNIYLRALISFIIRFNRIDEVKENYLKIGGKSPLKEITNQLITKLELKLDIPIFKVMRYLSPYSKEILLKCKKNNINELILFPMYPHYSKTTTNSSIEDIENISKEINYYPKIKIINPYYDNLDYIKMIANKIIKSMENKNINDYDLILSAHSLPQSIIKSGDLYEKHIEKNVSALKIYFEMNHIYFNEIKLGYQSKVGNSSWLTPSTPSILRNPTNLKVIIYPLSFTIDNFETVFELDIEYRDISKKIGYEDFIVSKVFNDDDIFVNFITNNTN